MDLGDEALEAINQANQLAWIQADRRKAEMARAPAPANAAA